MRKITERQTNLILKALCFYRKHVIDFDLAELNQESLIALDMLKKQVVKRIDVLFLQLSEEREEEN